MSQEPYALAMILCDSVYRDQASGKFTILGTFHAVRATAFPSNIQFCVYFAITDMVGTHTIRVQLVRAAEHLDDVPEEPIIGVDQELSIEDPLSVLEGVIAIGVAFPGPGVYHCELYAGTTPLLARRLTVIDDRNRSADKGNP